MNKFIIIEGALAQLEDLYVCCDEDHTITRRTKTEFLEEVCKGHTKCIEYRIVPHNWIVDPTDGSATDAQFCCHTFIHAPRSVFNKCTLWSVFDLLWDILDKR